MDLNKVMIIGRLTKDPDARSTPNGQSVSSFSVATNLIWKDQQGNKREKPEFHNIIAWRKLADICNQYLKKGQRVYVEGRLQTRSWQDPNGITKYRTEIIADNIIMLDKPGYSQPQLDQSQNHVSSSEANNQNPFDNVSNPPTQENNNNANENNEKSNDNNNQEEEIKIEDIPF
jgi:single-strand DNA-binding protein